MIPDFQQGDEVVLRHTGALGWVEEWIDEDTIMVEVDGDLIPVDVDDLMPAASAPGEPEGSHHPGETGSTAGPDSFRVPQGFHLLFVPDAHSAFGLFLINATAHSFMLEFGRLPGKTEHTELGPGEIAAAGSMAMDELNDNPVFQFASWRRKKGGGTDRPFRREIKLKASAFMKKLASLDREKEDGVCFTFFDDLPGEALQKIQVEAKVGPQNKVSEYARVYRGLSPDAMARASFPSEIDLHAEKLMKDPHKLPASKVLEIQMRKARDYMDRAIAMGLDRVYIIHGLGTGRLRQEVHQMLKEYQEVGHFHNGFHPKYGHGATEVEIR